MEIDIEKVESVDEQSDIHGIKQFVNGPEASNQANTSENVIIEEGSAKIEMTNSFYNAAQQFNRDLTILVLQQFLEDRQKELINNKLNGDGPVIKKAKIGIQDDAKIRVLDALSASGLRAVRFAKEVPGIGKIVANDFSEQAVSTIRKNVNSNGVENIVETKFGDAIELMMSNRSLDKRFHAIDLDPYGSSSIFLNSAVQAVTDGGILMITSTDMAVLCGNTPESCYNKYGCVGLRHKCCHEFAIRVLLKAVDAHANCYGRYIEPLISFSIDYYLRVFVKVHSGAKLAKDSATKVSHVFACSGCHSLQLQPLVRKSVNGSSVKFLPKIFDAGLVGAGGKCVHCDHSVHMAGPVYNAPIHKMEFVQRVIQRLKSTAAVRKSSTFLRMLGVLSVIAEELPDVPLYYEYDQLMHVVKSPVPKAVTIRSAIMNAGYKCSISHCNPKAIKTDAPTSFLWDIARSIAKNNNVSISRFSDGSPGRMILECEIRHSINFRLHPNAVEKSRLESMLRFQQSKGKNMGPKAKAKGSVDSIRATFNPQKGN